MPAIALTIDVEGDSKLGLLEKEMTFPEKQEYADALAGNLEELTRSHIADAAQSRHKTAERLGATPSQYLLNKASSVEAIGAPGRVLLSVSGEIFKRTFNPVTVRPVAAKMLTIPIAAESYGKRAGEFKDLFVFTSKAGNGFLCKRDGKAMKFLFLLKQVVVLPQDRGLLPSEEKIGECVEQTADDQLTLMMRKLTAIA